MARQLTFDLPVRTALGQEDFVVSEANAEAVALCEPGVRWPGGKLALAGPEASGKSHLAHVWAERSDGIVVAAAALARLDIPSLSGAGSIAVEDVPAIAGDRKADFDEVFDYLRNPDGPVAIALEQFIGAGWFLAPPPIK